MACMGILIKYTFESHIIHHLRINELMNYIFKNKIIVDIKLYILLIK